MTAPTYVFLQITVGGVKQFVNMTYVEYIHAVADGGTAFGLASGTKLVAEDDFDKIIKSLGNASSGPGQPGASGLHLPRN